MQAALVDTKTGWMVDPKTGGVKDSVTKKFIARDVALKELGARVVAIPDVAAAAVTSISASASVHATPLMAVASQPAGSVVHPVAGSPIQPTVAKPESKGVEPKFRPRPYPEDEPDLQDFHESLRRLCAPRRRY